MTDTATDKNSSAADDETSEMRFGAGETAWLAVVTVLALLGVALGVIALVTSGGDNGDGGGAAPPRAGATRPRSRRASSRSTPPTST